MPPITSTTRSTSSRATRPAASVVSSSVGHVDVARRVEPAYGDPDQLDRRADPRGEVAGLLVQQPHDLRADRAAAEQRRRFERLSSRSVHVRSAPSVGGQQVVHSLAADDDRGDAVPHRDHRRPQRVVVVAGHRAAVGAGAGHREQVARARRRRAGTRP